MSPQANTTLRTILSLLFLGAAAAHLAWLTPANALAVCVSITGILGGVLALSNLFHVPAKVVNLISKAYAVLSQAETDLPSETKSAMKKIACASVVLVVLGAATVATSETACTPQEQQQAANTIQPAVACVVDVVAAVQGSVDIADIIAKCGVTVENVIAIVSELLAAEPDATTLADGAAGASPNANDAHLRDVLARAYAFKAAQAK